MNEEMMTTGFTGGDTATGPTAGYDPVMKMRAKLKDLKGLVAPGNKLSTSNKKKIKEAAPLAAVAAKVAGKVAAKKAVGSAVGKAAVRGGIKVGGKSGGKFVKKAATNIVQNKVEKKVNQALGNQQQNEDKYDRYKRMIRHKQDKYGKGGPVGADYDTSKDPHYQKQKDQKREKIQKIVNKSKVDEAIAPSPQEIQVHKKISMLQQKLAQLRKKTVNQASKGAAAATDQEATQESTAYKYVSSINEKRKTKVNLNPTTKDTKGEGKFVNKYNPRYLSYTESVVDRCPPNKLFQYKVKLPEVGETVVYANSPAELMQKLRLLINPRFRGGIEIDRIFPHDAYKFFTDKRTKALRRK